MQPTSTWRDRALPSASNNNTRADTADIVPTARNFRSFSNPNYNSRSTPRFKRVGSYQVRIIDNKELYKGLASEAICSIDRPKLLNGENVDIEFTDFRPVASYTWVDKKEPVILVPGHPRIWTEETLPFTINKDEGTVFIDQNSSRLGTSPLLPLIIAVNHHDPNFHMNDMDFITDRNGLRKLYRWVNQTAWGISSIQVGQSQTTTTQPFRIDVELVGRTILLQRWEADSTQLGGPGYEKNFQKRTTSQSLGCEAGTGHHRIVTFTFGGKKFLMRCTTDACLPPKDDQDSDPLAKLTKNFTSMNLQSKPSAGRVRKIATFKGGFLSVQTVGKLVPQDSIIELKTKGEIVNPVCYDDLYVQLLFAQISNLYTGRHRRGEFYTVEKTSMEAIKEKAGDTMDDRLKLLKKLLDEIQRVVLESIEDGGSLSIVVGRNGTLKVLKREGGNGLLPENILNFIY